MSKWKEIFKKNNLDEMQEQKALKIEHNGCWFAFWGLFIAIMVQLVIYGPGCMDKLAGEWIVFMVLALYLVIGCLKAGIWDRRIRPNHKTNLVCSLVAGVIMAIVDFAIVYKNYGKLQGSIAAGVFTGAMVFVLCMVCLTIGLVVYQKSIKKLEDVEEM